MRPHHLGRRCYVSYQRVVVPYHARRPFLCASLSSAALKATRDARIAIWSLTHCVHACPPFLSLNYPSLPPLPLSFLSLSLSALYLSLPSLSLSPLSLSFSLSLNYPSLPPLPLSFLSLSFSFLSHSLPVSDLSLSLSLSYLSLSPSSPPLSFLSLSL